MIVRSCMVPHAVALRLDTEVRAALASMQAHALRHLPVVDDAGRLAGIVTERDLLLAARRGSRAVRVADLAHRDVAVVRDDAPITHAATLMARVAAGALPVIDARERLVGVVTETEIFRAFVSVLEAKTARTGGPAEVPPPPSGASQGALRGGGRQGARRTTAA